MENESSRLLGSAARPPLASSGGTPTSKRAVKPPRKRPSLAPDVPVPGTIEIEMGEADEVFQFATGDAKYNSWWHSVFCPCAKRAGNMSILYQTNLPNGEHRPVVVAGPYWPVMLCVTFPLLVGLSIAYAKAVLPHAPPMARGVYWLFTTWCCLLLFVVGLSNPGLLRRYRVKPDGCGSWRYSGQAQTYRPTHALYSRECNAVVQGFDHVCPWTGTAIGMGNEVVFDLFRNSVWLLLLFDVFLAFVCHVMSPQGVAVAAGFAFAVIASLLGLCLWRASSR